MRTATRAGALALSMAIALPALVGNSLVPAHKRTVVAKSALSVEPAREWNKLGLKRGPAVEEWTLDGDGLNDLSFYGGVAGGRPLLREPNRKAKPLPHFEATMLLTDVPELFEQSYRIAYDTPLMSIDGVEPASLAGKKAVRFRYTFTRPNEDVRRSGEALATIVDGRLFMLTFEAPDIYYFGRDVAEYRAIAASAQL